MTVTISDSYAQQDQTITLATNKNSYLPGDLVQLSGMVTGQTAPVVGIQVKDPQGTLILIRAVQADQNGNFAIQFKIPPTAISGNFSITASARVNGFIVTQTKVMTAAVPEFGPVAALVLAVAISSIVIFSAKNERLIPR
jgi:predicted secreted protein with PEFG-CTERM motif